MADYDQERVALIRALLNSQKKNINNMGGGLVNPSIESSADMETSFENVSQTVVPNLNTNNLAKPSDPMNKINAISDEINTKNANFWERLGGTFGEFGDNFITAFLNLGEGVVDAHLAIGGLFGADVDDLIKRDFTEEIRSGIGMNTWGENSFSNDANDWWRNVITGVEQGIGTSAGGALLSTIPYVGTALYGFGAGGMTLEESLAGLKFSDRFMFCFNRRVGICIPRRSKISMPHNFL